MTHESDAFFVYHLGVPQVLLVVADRAPAAVGGDVFDRQGLGAVPAGAERLGGVGVASGQRLDERDVDPGAGVVSALNRELLGFELRSAAAHDLVVPVETKVSGGSVVGGRRVERHALHAVACDQAGVQLGTAR